MVSLANEIRGVKVGHRFGTRRVIGIPFSRGRQSGRGGIIWSVVVECDCGRIGIISVRNVVRGLSDNCRPCHAHRKTILHGQSKTILHRLWSGMRNRCNNPRADRYDRYGGRGIWVCPEWDDFICFRAWALENGYSEGMTIDRKDNDGNYEPNNCQWLTRSDHANKTWAERRRRMK